MDGFYDPTHNTCRAHQASMPNGYHGDVTEVYSVDDMRDE